jgi:xylose isomerase
MSRTDLFHAHIGGIDTVARALLVAADMVTHETLARYRADRYRGWSGDLGRAILAGEASFDDLERRVAAGEIDPQPVSGGQELLENMVNQRIWSADRVQPS